MLSNQAVKVHKIAIIENVLIHQNESAVQFKEVDFFCGTSLSNQIKAHNNPETNISNNKSPSINKYLQNNIIYFNIYNFLLQI